MQKITSSSELRAAILELESKHREEGRVLKKDINATVESMKPVNIIKSILKKVSASDEVKESLLNTTIVLAAGYASKVLFEELSGKPLKKTLGTTLLFGITTIATKNPEAVIMFGKGVFKIFSNGIKKNEAL